MTDPVSAPISVEDVVARIDEWQDKDVLCQELGGGITNRNYVATVLGGPDEPGVGKFVIRIPGEGTDTFIDRTRELSNHRAAAAAGVTPPLLHVIQPGDCTVVPFIEGETMHPESIAGHPDRLEKIVAAMRTYHDKAVFTNEIRVFDMIREYLHMAKDVGAPRPAETDWMLEQGGRIEAAMQRDAPAFTACHNDLLSENFILAPDGKMWVIDWEYGGMTDPYFDLGDFCVETPLTEAEERGDPRAVLRRLGRAPLRTHDAAQARGRPVVEHLGHDPGDAQQARVRLLRLRHGPHPPHGGQRRASRLRGVAHGRLNGAGARAAGGAAHQARDHGPEEALCAMLCAPDSASNVNGPRPPAAAGARGLRGAGRPQRLSAAAASRRLTCADRSSS